MATLTSRKFSILEFDYATGDPLVFEATFALGVMTPLHIQVFVEGELDGLDQQLYRDFTYDAITETVTVTDPITVPDGQDDIQVTVQRTVPKEQLYISFKNGADVTKTNIDGMVRYTLMALHEVLDGRWDVSQDWKDLYQLMLDMYNAVLNMLRGGTTGQVLTKLSGTDLDFTWMDYNKLAITDLSAELALSYVMVQAWRDHIILLPSECVAVTLNADSGFVIGDEFIVQGYRAWMLNLGAGVSIAGTPAADLRTQTQVSAAPGGLLFRMVAANKWLIMGDGYRV